jgi:hypothetical protein
MNTNSTNSFETFFEGVPWPGMNKSSNSVRGLPCAGMTDRKASNGIKKSTLAERM